jgi:ferric-dicitrate binding protein FerR (iron transport regulator)
VSRPDPELDRWLMDLVDGEMSPDQQADLLARLRDDPEARARYVSYLLVDSHLAWEQTAAAGGTDGAAHLLGRWAAGETARSQARRRRPRRAASLAAAALLAAFAPLAAVGLSRWRGPAAPPAAATPPAAPPAAVASATAAPGRPDVREGMPRARGVAVLTRSVDVAWEDGSPSPVIGSSLAAGVLRLRSGSLQLEFYGGATVVVEGPAEIELKAIDRIACRSGKLRAHVPPRARGFRVESPAVDLVDLGTEFGMQVVPGRDSEVHVFDGKVELHETASRAGRASRWELGQGHGVRIGTAGDVTPLAANSPTFLSPPDLERLYRKESRRRYDRWAAGSRSLHEDRRLVSYFSFEGDRDSGSRALINGCGGRSTDGAIVGCEWVDGRWPGKGALEFKRPSDRVRIYVPGEFASLSLAAWVRVDSIENRFNSLMLTDGFEPGEAHWQIDCDGRIVLGVRLPRALKVFNKDYNSPRVITPERFGRWTHLATVSDRRAGTVSHYVDGVAVSSEAIAHAGALRIGDAELGNWGVPHVDDFGPDPTPLRNLCGRMDEFAVFGEALGPGEIRALYERGMPGP